MGYPWVIEQVKDLLTDVADLQSSALRKSGGTMTGVLDISAGYPAIRLKNNDSTLTAGYVDIHVINSTGLRNANIRFNQTAEINDIVFTPLDESNGTMWKGSLEVGLNKSTKTAYCKWGGNHILTTAGGTLTGALRLLEHDNIIGYNNDTTNGYKYTTFQAGTWDVGARIQMMRHDSPKDAGHLVLRGGTTDFRVKPDGTATLNSKAVLTSAGGAVGGQFTFTGGDDVIKRNIDNGRTVIWGGSSWETSAYIEICGGQHTQGGAVVIHAKNSQQASQLSMHPNGQCYVAGGRVLTLTASWSNGTNWYRKYSDGWIEQGGHVSGANATVVNFHTAFSNTNYQVIGTLTKTDTSIGSQGGVQFYNKTTTSCRLHWLFLAGDQFDWYACGY